MARRQHEPEEGHGGTERWLLTYADMITLLMAFFIMLTSISQVDAQKWRKASASMSGKFGYAEGYMRSGTGGQGFGKMDVTAHAGFMGFPSYSTRIKVDIKHVGRKLQRDKLNRDVKLAMEARGLIISLTAGVLFDLQSSTLKPSAKKLLDDLGIIFAELPNSIVIEGHTDEQSPIGRPPPSPNWELSARRAMAVMDYLVQQGYIAEKRLSLGAFSSNKPFRSYSMDMEERNRLNRRVDIVILGDTPEASRFDVIVPGEGGEDKVGW